MAKGPARTIESAGLSAIVIHACMLRSSPEVRPSRLACHRDRGFWSHFLRGQCPTCRSCPIIPVKVLGREALLRESHQRVNLMTLRWRRSPPLCHRRERHVPCRHQRWQPCCRATPRCRGEKSGCAPGGHAPQSGAPKRREHRNRRRCEAVAAPSAVRQPTPIGMAMRTGHARRIGNSKGLSAPASRERTSWLRAHPPCSHSLWRNCHR